jgi:hypothetical protein
MDKASRLQMIVQVGSQGLYVRKSLASKVLVDLRCRGMTNCGHLTLPGGCDTKHIIPIIRKTL